MNAKVPTKEFGRRLIRLRRAIDIALVYHRLNGDILPALFSAFTYCFCRNTFKSNKK